MAIKGIMAFRDADGESTRVQAYFTAAGDADMLSGFIAGVTNAGQQNVDTITVTPHAAMGVMAVYASKEDKAQLVFKDVAGAIHRYQIPAPITSLFLPDQETVDPMDPTGIIGHFLALAVSLQGDALSAFVSGHRLRRKEGRQ